MAINPTNTIFDAKRLIGRKFADATVQSDMKHWPFKVVDSGSLPMLAVEYKNETLVFKAKNHLSKVEKEQCEVPMIIDHHCPFVL